MIRKCLGAADLKSVGCGACGPRESQRVLVCRFLEVYAETLDSFRSAVAQGGEFGIVAAAKNLRRTVPSLALEAAAGLPPIVRHGECKDGCRAVQALVHLHEELARLAEPLQVLVRS